jgi:hypothetical protein
MKRKHTSEKNDINPKIKSKKISKKKKKKKDKYHIHQCINTLKRKFIKYLDNRYEDIDNKNDLDIISYKKINRIPKNNLYIFNLSNGKKMGCECTNLIIWFATFIENEYEDEIELKNIFTNELLSIDEMKNICSFGNKYLRSNIYYKKYYLDNYPEEYFYDCSLFKDSLYKLRKFIEYLETPYYRYNEIVSSLQYHYSRLNHHRITLQHYMDTEIIGNRCLCIDCLNLLNQDENILNNRHFNSTILPRMAYRINCIYSLENEINEDFYDEDYNYNDFDPYKHIEIGDITSSIEKTSDVNRNDDIPELDTDVTINNNIVHI